MDRTLYISGQLGLTTSGQMAEGGVLGEAEQALENIGNILLAAGGSELNILTPGLALNTKHIPQI